MSQRISGYSSFPRDIILAGSLTSTLCEFLEENPHIDIQTIRTKKKVREKKIKVLEVIYIVIYSVDALLIDSRSITGAWKHISACSPRTAPLPTGVGASPSWKDIAGQRDLESVATNHSVGRRGPRAANLHETILCTSIDTYKVTYVHTWIDRLPYRSPDDNMWDVNPFNPSPRSPIGDHRLAVIRRLSHLGPITSQESISSLPYLCDLYVKLLADIKPPIIIHPYTVYSCAYAVCGCG
ncbi:hypothetical protein BU24DRAFT_119015 [Aaosphaeria arxii CBS 175.79]|uniref:Uncharacterized protein n=1 Tax=Aaosphaeria arxii CBS 175.79 TaxID=1450172 RepID=A0A6A5Y1N3_9PLEO|nr:uncharacterized protein BU24DRAFT_119015 [Aaosphaeria arxii CBS 175.79]KAF2019388.1 hypothetical protein BU24DRAFT_119015 [Aaosphaeria arxii CBS 175.79]